MEDILILECPRCYRIYSWYRELESNGPGTCPCGSFQYWKVLKERPKYKKGYVIVYSYLGWQELKGPNWTEDPTKWNKI